MTEAHAMDPGVTLSKFHLRALVFEPPAHAVWWSEVTPWSAAFKISTYCQASDKNIRLGIIYLTQKLTVPENSLQGGVFTHPCKEDRWKDLVLRICSWYSEHLLNFCDASSRVVDIGEICSWKAKNATSNTTEFIDLGWASLRNRLRHLETY